MVLCDTSPTNQHRVSQAPAVSGLSGEGSVSKHTHVVVGRIHLLAGSWPGLLCCSEAKWETPRAACLQHGSLTFQSQQAIWERPRGGGGNPEAPIFYNPISKATSHHFCCILIVGSESLGPAQHWRGGDLYKEMGSLRAILEAANHTWSSEDLRVFRYISAFMFICIIKNKKKPYQSKGRHSSCSNDYM